MVDSRVPANNSPRRTGTGNQKPVPDCQTEGGRVSGEPGRVSRAQAKLQLNKHSWLFACLVGRVSGYLWTFVEEEDPLSCGGGWMYWARSLIGIDVFNELGMINGFF